MPEAPFVPMKEIAMECGGSASALDLWMPLNFGQFLRSTSNLNPEQAVEYVQSLAMDWLRKRERAQRKARWAAMVRWARTRGLDPSTLEHSEHHPSIDFASISGQKKLRQWLANCKKRSEKARHAARARWARRVSAPSIAVGAGSPLLHISPVLTTAYSTTTPLPPGGIRSLVDGIVGALGGNLARGAFAGFRKDGSQQRRASKGKETGQGALPVASDERYDQFRAEVLKFWRAQNHSHPDCPWERRDRRALEKLIENHQELTFDVFCQLLVNRAGSEINPSQLPRRWLGSIFEYAAGPLDRFGKPKQLSPKQAGVYVGDSKIPPDEIERLRGLIGS